MLTNLFQLFIIPMLSLLGFQTLDLSVVVFLLVVLIAVMILR